MKVLFIGDIYGKAGRETLSKYFAVSKTNLWTKYRYC